MFCHNDYAVGRIVEKVAKSKRYSGNTLVSVVEDNAQDGPDHVNAHRSIAFVAGPYVKQGAVVSKKYTTVSLMATIIDILGIEHLGTYDALDRPMTDVFSKKTKKWDFNSIGPDILRSSQLPLPVATAKNTLKKDALSAFYAKPRYDASYWAAKTEGFDFSREDRVDTPRNTTSSNGRDWSVKTSPIHRARCPRFKPEPRGVAQTVARIATPGLHGKFLNRRDWRAELKPKQL